MDWFTSVTYVVSVSTEEMTHVTENKIPTLTERNKKREWGVHTTEQSSDRRKNCSDDNGFVHVMIVEPM